MAGNSLISFTNNYRDVSTDMGFQFEFICDGCGNGHMSQFVPNKLGMGASVMRTASGLLGGLMGGGAGRAATASDEMKNALRGKARDDALREAVGLAKGVFKNCTRCGNWVCPTACWNEKRNMCDKCAPDIQEELISAQANAQKEQIWRESRSRSLLDNIDVTNVEGAGAVRATCGSCGTVSNGGKFCHNCGAAVASKPKCGKCGVEGVPGAKFCNECGNKF